MASSRITEIVGELEQLHDDVILEIYEKDEASRAGREIKTIRKKHLVSWPRNRTMALRRKLKDSEQLE